MIFIIIAVVAGVVAIVAFSLLGAVNKAERQAKLQLAKNDEAAQMGNETGARYRATALKRQREGYVPDPITEFERNLALDSIAMKMQTVGVTMPDSYRELLGHLELEELQEILDVMNM